MKTAEIYLTKDIFTLKRFIRFIVLLNLIPLLASCIQNGNKGSRLGVTPATNSVLTIKIFFKNKIFYETSDIPCEIVFSTSINKLVLVDYFSPDSFEGNFSYANLLFKIMDDNTLVPGIIPEMYLAPLESNFPTITISSNHSHKIKVNLAHIVNFRRHCSYSVQAFYCFFGYPVVPGSTYPPNVWKGHVESNIEEITIK